MRMPRPALLVATLAVWMSASPVVAASPAAARLHTPPRPSASRKLEIVGPTGTRVLSIADLRRLPATDGWAGVKSSTGKISLPERVRGVALKDLLATVKGFGDSTNVRVVAADGYAVTLTHDQVMRGGFTAYDPATGDSLGPGEPTVVVLSYERRGRPLDLLQGGALRLEIVAATSGQVADGHWSVKWVTRLELVGVKSEWTLSLVGARSEEMDRATFETGAAPNCHGAVWKDGQGREWAGIPLWLLVGRVDDAVPHGDGAFNDSLAAAGYVVDVIAGDGHRATFESSRVSRNGGIVVAHLFQGRPLPDGSFPLRLVGAALANEEMIGRIARVEIRPPSAPPATH